MFVLSFKSTKLKMILLAIAAALAALLLIWVVGRDKKPAVSSGAINYSAQNAEERIAFLSQFGWEVDEDPIEVTEVVIPGEFDTVYSRYNEIQASQKLDLKPYANARVKRWSYVVKNYPGQENNDSIRANLLVYDGRVIGGDICSVALDGFMHGFETEKLKKKESPAKAETTKAEATKSQTKETTMKQENEKSTQLMTQKAETTKKVETTSKEKDVTQAKKESAKKGCNQEKETTTQKMGKTSR